MGDLVVVVLGGSLLFTFIVANALDTLGWFIDLVRTALEKWT